MTSIIPAMTFVLVLSSGTVDAPALTTIPYTYPSGEVCESAGEEARRWNQGIALLSYTCVPVFEEPFPSPRNN